MAPPDKPDKPKEKTNPSFTEEAKAIQYILQLYCSDTQCQAKGFDSMMYVLMYSHELIPSPEHLPAFTVEAFKNKTLPGMEKL